MIWIASIKNHNSVVINTSSIGSTIDSRWHNWFYGCRWIYSSLTTILYRSIGELPAGGNISTVLKQKYCIISYFKYIFFSWWCCSFYCHSTRQVLIDSMQIEFMSLYPLRCSLVKPSTVVSAQHWKLWWKIKKSTKSISTFPIYHNNNLPPIHFAANIVRYEKHRQTSPGSTTHTLLFYFVNFLV